MLIVFKSESRIHPVMVIAGHVFVEDTCSASLWPTSQMQCSCNILGQVPAMMYAVKYDMANVLADVCQYMDMICSGVIVAF